MLFEIPLSIVGLSTLLVNTGTHYKRQVEQGFLAILANWLSKDILGVGFEAIVVRD